MASIEDIQPKRGKYNTYCLLRTVAGTFSCSEKLAEKLCLYEPYEMRGQVRFVLGGTYLWVSTAELFNAGGYKRQYT
jgi:hypothetical protein